MFKNIVIVAAMLLVSCSAWAGIIQVNSEANFISLLQPSYLHENFDNVSNGDFVGQVSQSYTQNGYTAAFAANDGLFGLDGSLSTYFNNDALKVTFSSNVSAVGGFFFPTDVAGSYNVGTIKLTLTDGSSVSYQYDFDQSIGGPAFVGFITNPVVSITSLSFIPARSSDYFPTVDNFYAGSVYCPPNPVPEPSIILLLGVGVGAVGLFTSRVKK
jgi:hypothetical protein